MGIYPFAIPILPPITIISVSKIDLILAHNSAIDSADKCIISFALFLFWTIKIRFARLDFF